MKHEIIIKLKIELSVPLYCSICGQPILDNQQMSLDHYIPRCHGGRDVAANLFPAHKICNSIKNDFMPDEFEDKYGLDKNNPADAMQLAANGYTNIENYLFLLEQEKMNK